MMIFWLGVGVMLLAVLGWVLPAFWSREAFQQPTRDDHVVQAYEDRVGELEADFDEGIIDADQLENARDEMAADLVADVRDDATQRVRSSSAPLSAMVAGMVVIGVSIVVYQTVGTPEGLHIAGKGLTRAQAVAARQSGGAAPAPAPQAGAAAAAGNSAMPSIEQMVEGLAQRLADNPEDAEGWMMLGRSYLVLDRLTDAREALDKAIALRPDNADTLANYAEVIARMADNQLNGEPTKYLADALKVNPGHPKALWLSGIAAMQRNAAPEAVRHWQVLRETGALNAEESAQLDQMIVEAGGKAPDATATAMAPAAPPVARAPVPAPAAASQTAAEGGVRITVRVTLDGALSERVRPGDSLFVFARAEKGPPMPLAVQRLTAADLPVTVVLDESMAMMPQFTIGTFPRVVVGARISRTGNATPSAGDLQGLSDAVTPSDQPQVQVIIHEVI